MYKNVLILPKINRYGYFGQIFANTIFHDRPQVQAIVRPRRYFLASKLNHQLNAFKRLQIASARLFIVHTVFKRNNGLALSRLSRRISDSALRWLFVCIVHSYFDRFLLFLVAFGLLKIELGDVARVAVMREMRFLARQSDRELSYVFDGVVKFVVVHYVVLIVVVFVVISIAIEFVFIVSTGRIAIRVCLFASLTTVDGFLFFF